MEILKKIWAGWKKFGLFIGNFVGRLFLTLFYFTVFVPFGVGQTLLGDRLDMKNNQRRPTWLERKTTDLSIKDARRQS